MLATCEAAGRLSALVALEADAPLLAEDEKLDLAVEEDVGAELVAETTPAVPGLRPV